MSVGDSIQFFALVAGVAFWLYRIEVALYRIAKCLEDRR